MQFSYSFLCLPALGLLAASGTTPLTPPAGTAALVEVAPVEAVTPERLLRAVPGDAIAMAAAWNLDEMREQGSKSAWYRFYQDEQVQTFADALSDMVAKAWAEEADAPELPFSLTEVWDALHGSVVGFINVDVPEEIVVGGLLIDPAGKREALEEIFDKIVAMAEEELEGSPDSYGGADLIRMTGMGGGDEDSELIFIDHPDLMGVIISNRAELAISSVQGSLDRFSGTDDSGGFDGSASLREARASGVRGADLEFFVDCSPVIDAVLAEEQPGEDELKIMERVGLTDLRWFYGASDMGAGETGQMTISGYLPPNSYISDAFNLMGPASVEMLKQIPAGTDAVSVSRFDVHGLFKLIMRGVQEHNNEAYQQVNGMVQMMGAMNGIDIEEDLLAQITGDFASFMIPSTAEGGAGQAMMTGVTPGGAMLIGIEDPEEFELFLDDVMSNFQLDQMIETEEFMGRELRSFDMGGPKAYFTFTDSALIYAGGLEPMQAALRLGSTEDLKTAYDDPELRKLASMNPMSLSRANTAASIAMQLDMMANMSEMFGMMGLEDDENPLAYLPWPDSSLAKKYFKGDLFTTAVREGDVFVIKSWSE